MENLQHGLLAKVGADCVGIFWFTDDALSRTSDGAFELDYLTDGALKEILMTPQTRQQSQNFLLSQSFGNTFFVAHQSCEANLDDIKKFVPLVQSNVQRKGTALVLNKSKRLDTDKIVKKLAKQLEGLDILPL